MTKFIGRTATLNKLTKLLEKNSASFVVVYGRRRIGKSSLIEHFSREYRFLSFEGLSPRIGITKQDQLDEFSHQLVRQCATQYKKFTDWGDALHNLSLLTQNGRVVILLDEISWMALEDPDLPGKIKIAWDKYLKKNPQLVLFVCGSVSSWIEKNIVNSTGFHGRISLKIRLQELSLASCKYFWGKNQAKISNYEKLTLLAVTGGIPKYLEEVQPQLTAEENIRQLAFHESGILFNDFHNIFTDILLRKSDIYEKIVRLLCNGPIDSSIISNKLGIKKGRLS